MAEKFKNTPSYEIDTVPVWNVLFLCTAHLLVSAFNCAPCGELVHTGIGWGGGGLN